MKWHEIEGWFQWRSAQEEAVRYFPQGSCFVEVGSYLGRSLCSLAEIVEQSGKRITLVGVDSCRGSGPEGLQKKNYHGAAVERGGGTFAGELHRNVVDCRYDDLVSLIIADSVMASRFFPDASVDWVHLDASHDFSSVKRDIEAWLPKVKIDGWLSGDDYDEIKWPGLVKAVGEVLPDARAWSTHQWRLIVS